MAGLDAKDGISADIGCREAGAADAADAADIANSSARGRSEVLSPERDRMESLLLPAAMALDKPILGICRGIQFINKYLGGTLWQDLPSEHPSAVEHHMNPPYDTFGHSVSLIPGTPLASLFAGQSEIAVNSYHHQAVREAAPGLNVMAVAPDGVIEALYRPASRFLWAVQWHPEFLYKVDARSQAIFNAFVKSCHR
ncbi:gamma-glutamyl-gamma-aminobutyrate hydrolase family protein [Bifidobacterium imperatoris]|nr:gamma-glutamyl-gamma-aminobutyrate hydrolase family protein [Bifidobacterium imperatoris]